MYRNVEYAEIKGISSVIEPYYNLQNYTKQIQTKFKFVFRLLPIGFDLVTIK